MDWQNFLVLLSFVFNLILGLVIYFRAPKRKAYLAFLFTIFGIVGWCFAMFFYRAANIQTAMFWARLLYLFPTFIPAGFIIFGLMFPNYRLNKLILLSVTLLNLAIGVLCFVPKAIIVAIDIPLTGEKIIYFGWAYFYLYLFYIPMLFVLSYLVLFKKYKTATPLVRQQILYILLGLTGASGIGMTTNLILPTFAYFELNWLGQVTLFFWVGCVTYAIVKHRLIDIRLVVARTISYSFLLLSFALFYIFALFNLSRFVYGTKINNGQITINVILTLIIAFTFQPLRRFLERITDKIFFKDRYDTEELLSQLTKIISSSLFLKNIAQSVLEKLLGKAKISKGAIILLENKKIKQIFYQNGNKPPDLSFKDIQELVCSRFQPLILDELNEGKRKNALRKIGFYFSQCLKTKDKNIGLLLLGEKLSGDIYSTQDVEFLEILAPQLAVAIQNALAYQKIQQFSETLKKEIKKATESLKKTNKRLKQVSALKDEFVSLTSHELRTPLTAIAGSLATVLEGYAGKINSQVKEFLQASLNESNRLIRLVNNLLNISRIEAGRLKFDFTSFNLKELVMEVGENLSGQAKEKKLPLILFCPDKIIVRADKDKVREVLINLIGNALKYTDQGWVKVTVSEQKNLALVSIEDTGRGVLAQDQQKLFHKFERVNSVKRAERKGGTGLGLYICRNLIKNMGGEVWLKSQHQKGSTFYFTLPLV